MPILNYTTTVPVEQTQGEVIKALTRRGVTRISTLFDDDGEVAGLGFTMKTDYGYRDFELPVRTDGVLVALQASADRGEFARLGVSPAKLRMYLSRAHAAKVAWRIAKDWLEAQSALIDANLASLDEVMLPYMITDHGTTVYDAFRQTQLQLTQ